MKTRKAQMTPSESELTMSPANSRGKKIGFWLGIISFLIIICIPAPGGLSREAWWTLALLSLMMCWWVSEALPIGITSLLPLVIAPLFGIAAFTQAAPAYAHPIIFLLMGGFIIGKSVERWNLHERIALRILTKAGSKPTAIIAGFMLTSAVLSMWISNTATVIMLVPIVISLAASSNFEGEDRKNFTLMALLGTAWAASIGGLGTPVGTPPNLIIIGFLEQQGDMRFTFGRWMMFGIPAVIVMLPAAFFVLTKFGPKLGKSDDMKSASLFKEKLDALGAITVPERRVMIVFGCIAFFWIFRRAFIQDLTVLGVQPFAGINDSLIAIAGVIALFAIPSGSAAEPGTRLLDWPTAVTIPWDILLLFGGGLSLAAIIQLTGLSAWLGAELAFVGNLPTLVTTFILVAMVIFLTELTSNTATAAAIMPVVGAIALETGMDAAALAVPIALAASCAFMLPMATGPNAVIFGSGKITMGQMAKAGFKLNLLGVVLITGLASVLAGLVL